MPVRVRCPTCGKGVQAPSKYRGRAIKCPGCKSPIVVPEAVKPEETIPPVLLPPTPIAPPPPHTGFFTEGADNRPEFAPRNTFLSLFFSFQGRIPRRTFWFASLAVAAMFYAMLIVMGLTFNKDSLVVVTLYLLAHIPVFWSSFAMHTKRWHDRDKSGAGVCVGFIPIFGAIWAFVETGCLRGTVGPNSYGADPT